MNDLGKIRSTVAWAIALQVVTVLALFVGWVSNTINVVKGFVGLEALGDASGLLILQTISLFIPPLGGIMGLIFW